MKKTQKKQAFTLIELIVVITILAILWTIAFMALQWYSSQARDSKRLSDIQNIKKSLELFSINTWKYPLADDFFTVSYSWEQARHQWTIWDDVITNLSKNLAKKPTDPLTGLEYTYSTTHSQTEYEVLGLYESDLVWIKLISNSFAENQDYPKIEWNYNWIYVKTPNFYVPTPSIINWDLFENTDLINNLTFIKSQVTTGWDNLIWTNTWNLNIELHVYTWTINEDSTDEEKEDFIDILIETYSWSDLEEEDIYINIIEIDTIEEINNFINNVILKWSYTNNNTYSVSITWWRALDSNCNIDDILIWDQTWAWCNSTLWNWLERWQINSDLWGWGYNWEIWTCNYYYYNTWDCTLWSTNMTSNTLANSWFSWTNDFWVNEFNNIWWKFYTWSNSNSACPTWRHVPSDIEWNNLLAKLNWWTNCENWWVGLLCDWLWWYLHSDTNINNESNNLANALKIPLSGFRDSNGIYYYSRGNQAWLWSSTQIVSNKIYYRYLFFNSNDVGRNLDYEENYAFSVRCLKD